MVKKGITFNGKHSYKDMGITMTGERNISFPMKRKIKVQPPYSNASYDFSELYGDQIYDERALFYQFNLIDYAHLDYSGVQQRATVIANWLLDSGGKVRLQDDDISGYYFLAEVEGDLDIQHFIQFGILNVTFIAYPFKIATRPEGHDIWDEFNFELDFAQPTEFTISGTRTIKLINNGIKAVTPTITTSAAMTVKIGNQTYNLNSGTSRNDRLQIPKGENDIVVTGNGSIKFDFHKELI